MKALDHLWLAVGAVWPFSRHDVESQATTNESPPEADFSVGTAEGQLLYPQDLKTPQELGHRNW